MAIGSLSVVILLHVPYVRRSGVLPYGEYQLYEAMADAFVPLFDTVAALAEEDLHPRFTFAVSPVLAEQLTDGLLRTGFEEYVLRRMRPVEEDSTATDSALASAARLQLAQDNGLLESWVDRHQRDLMYTVRQLERDGLVETISYPATGAVLPLLPRVSAKRGQVDLGMRSVEFHVEHRTLGMWLPGGAIAPGAEGEGVGDLLVDAGVEYTLVGDRAIRSLLPVIPGGKPKGLGGGSPLDMHRLPSGLVAMVRHEGFSAATIGERGFPSHTAYLGAADPFGRRYWRRGPKSPPGPKVAPSGPKDAPPDYYRPEDAAAAAREHAAATVEMAVSLLSAHKEQTGRAGLLVLPIDSRLFCTWAEGPLWLSELVRGLKGAQIKMESGAEAMHHHNLQSLPEVAPSSWEGEGDFRTWQADNTSWYWDVVATTLDHAENLADRFGGVHNPVMMRLQAQATREALLLVSSEWPEMVGHGGEELDYAAERVRSHHDRFRRLAYMLDTNNPEELDSRLLERYEELDNPFGDIDLGLLAAERPHPSADTDSSYRPWGGTGPGGIF